MEIDIIGTKYRTTVDENGVVRSYYRGRKERKAKLHNNGYMALTVVGVTKMLSCTIHCLFCTYHIPIPNKLPQFDHIDGNRLNN